MLKCITCGGTLLPHTDFWETTDEGALCFDCVVKERDRHFTRINEIKTIARGALLCLGNTGAIERALKKIVEDT